MPNWNGVLNEIEALSAAGTGISAVDIVRRKYIKQLADYSGRNVIVYYSGWLSKPPIDGVAICDDDKNGFMNAVPGLDRSVGLDLVLHTPGGDIAATESLVHYLRCLFGTDIRAIVPQVFDVCWNHGCLRLQGNHHGQAVESWAYRPSA